MTEQNSVKKSISSEENLKISPRKARATPKAKQKIEALEVEPQQVWEESDEEMAEYEDDEIVAKQPASKGKDRSVLSLPITLSLHRKLKFKAQQEGVTVEDLVSELIAEGLVLRAWEIMERKSAMRGGQSGNSNAYPNNRPNNNNNNNRNFRSPNNNANFSGGRRPFGGNTGGANNPGGNNHRRNNYNNILEDSAHFIEYVRSQEKKQR